MNKLIEKYTYRIEWSEEDKTQIARCLEFPSLATHGETADEALHEIRKVVEETIKWMKEDNEPIPEPLGLKKFKGNLSPKLFNLSVLLKIILGIPYSAP